VRGLAVADSFDLLLPLWCVVLISVIVDREWAIARNGGHLSWPSQEGALSS
jgi:hypothetical protein